MKNQLLKAGTKVFGALAFPAFILAGNKHGSLELGILLTLVGAPITFPCLLVFGPAYGYFSSKLDQSNLDEDR